MKTIFAAVAVSALASTAHASNDSEGFLPTASPMEAGAGYAGVNVDTVIGGDFVWSLMSVRAEYGVSDQLAVNAVGATVIDYTHASHPSDGGLFAAWYPGFGASYLAIDNENFRLATFTQAAFNVVIADAGAHIGTVGVAIEGGGERLRADLALPVLTAMSVDSSWEFTVFPAPLDTDSLATLLFLLEGGVSYALTDRDTFRVGKSTVFPYLMWIRDLEALTIEVGGIYWGADFGIVHLGAGLDF